MTQSGREVQTAPTWGLFQKKKKKKSLPQSGKNVLATGSCTNFCADVLPIIVEHTHALLYFYRDNNKVHEKSRRKSVQKTSWFLWLISIIKTKHTKNQNPDTSTAKNESWYTCSRLGCMMKQLVWKELKLWTKGKQDLDTNTAEQTKLKLGHFNWSIIEQFVWNRKKHMHFFFSDDVQCLFFFMRGTGSID